MPGKGKKRNSKNTELDEQKRQAEEAERLLQLKQQEEERQKMWIESWDRKLAEEERLEDCKACCAPDDFFRRPKTQSNVWVQINHEKNTQHVHMAFKNVPVPKPKPPPLPKLKIIDAPKPEEEKKRDSKGGANKKKGGKKKKK